MLWNSRMAYSKQWIRYRHNHAYKDRQIKANMGILIGDKSVWGKGFGTEAWCAVMKYLFDHGIRKVEAGFALPNTGMRRICNKSGMKYEGSRPDHFLIDGKPEYLDLYGKFK
jgi:ribosomal-protein-alanine N-acetyltransferase